MQWWWSLSSSVAGVLARLGFEAGSGDVGKLQSRMTPDASQSIYLHIPSVMYAMEKTNVLH